MRLLTITLVAAVLAAACERELRPPVYVTPGLPFAIPDTVAAWVRDSVVAHQLDYRFDSLSGSVDEQLLHTGTCPGPTCGHGPRATIQPERGSHNLTPDSFQVARVIARLINSDTLGYPKFGLVGRDTVFWVVRQVGQGYQSLFVSTAPGSRALVGNIRPDGPHQYGPWWQALARFIWRPDDESLWATCSRNWCCQSDGVALD